MKGKIVRLLHSKGFGFVRGADEITRFFHASETKNFDFLREEMEVEFTPFETNDAVVIKGNGYRAKQVTPC